MSVGAEPVLVIDMAPGAAVTTVTESGVDAVSYTHLDVYKRQVIVYVTV